MEDDSLGNLYAAFENHPGKHSDPMGLGNWAMEYEPGYFVSAVLKVGELVDTVARNPIGVTRAVAVDIVSQPFYTAQDLVYAMAEMNDEQIRRLGYPGYRSWLIGTLERKIMDGSSGLEAFASVVTEGAISYAVPAIGFKFAGKALGKIAKNCPYNKLAPTKAKFKGEPFAFGTGIRSERAKNLVKEMENLTGTNVHKYVDQITYQPGSSNFDVFGGYRVLTVGSEAFTKTRTGQLIEVAHELVHAQKWHHTLHYKYKGDYKKAMEEFFEQKYYGSPGYAFDEVVAESLAVKRIENVLQLSHQQRASSTKYIKHWRQYH